MTTDQLTAEIREQRRQLAMLLRQHLAAQPKPSKPPKPWTDKPAPAKRKFTGGGK